METPRGHLLIVDDNAINRKVLTRALTVLGHTTATANDGLEALTILRDEGASEFDVVLLDVLMPELDGYGTLAQIKADPALRHLPVIMISALDELSSVIRCIELGAEDYLPKPFDPTLLRARLGASLERKRFHDQEREYLRQVEHLTVAAAAIEGNTFEPEVLATVAERPDALGHLARVFGRMAREVHARERRLRQQLEQLRLDGEERQQAEAETVASYLAMDRRQALARGAALPEVMRGAALFLDISGFTPLAATLARELGLQRGAEELIRRLNRVLGALIDGVHSYGGSVIGYSGDAITCWFDGDIGDRATACALALQEAMIPLATIVTPSGVTLPLAIKVAVAAGVARRIAVGDPQIQLLDTLAGRPLVEVAQGEQLAKRGDIILAEATARTLGSRLTIAEWRADPRGERYAVVTALAGAVPTAPWPPLPHGGLAAGTARPWVLPAVYERVADGKSEFLAELRPAAALFLGFSGIAFDTDAEAATKLDRFVRWAQGILTRYDAALLQVTIGDKGSNLYAAFGAPIAHDDDAARAVAAALELRAPPPDLSYIGEIAIGVAYGQMRAGASGSGAYRSYAVQGPKTNLAARLMQAAGGAGILCDEGVYEAARGRTAFEVLPPILVKGVAEPVAIYRPVAGVAERAIGSRIDRLAPAQQLTLKIASVIGPVFNVALLRAIHPIARDQGQLDEHLAALTRAALIRPQSLAEGGGAYTFSDPEIREVAYGLLLFAQRRRLHRTVAEWYERHHASDLHAVAALLGHHWSKAEDAAKAILYYEQAGGHARRAGAFGEAARLLQEALKLDANASVVSAEYHVGGETRPQGR